MTDRPSSFDSLVPASSSTASLKLRDTTDVQVLSAFLRRLNGDVAKGLSELFDRFKQAGLGSRVDSWVTSDVDAPINAKEIEKAFGEEHMAALEGELETISRADLYERLSRILPQLISYLTPAGEIPSTRLLAHNVKALLKELG